LFRKDVGSKEGARECKEKSCEGITDSEEPQTVPLVLVLIKVSLERRDIACLEAASS